MRGDGSFIGAGATSWNSGEPLVFRFTASGDLDLGWSGDGSAEIPLQADELGRFRATVETDEGVVAVGRTGETSKDTLTVARFASDGALDPGFGEGGVLRHQLESTPGIEGVFEVDGSRLLVFTSSRDPDHNKLYHFYRIWL